MRDREVLLLERRPPRRQGGSAGDDLGRLVGIEVPDVERVRAAGKDVLLVERFDRTAAGGRRLMVSGPTVLGLSENSAPDGSYPMSADVVTTSFADPARALEQLYRWLAVFP